MRRKLILAWAVLGTLSGTMTTRAGYYAWWHLNDGQGDVAKNAVAGGTDGTITDANTAGLGPGGSVWANDAERGIVLGLNGTTGWIEAGELPTMSVDNQFSLTFWGKQLAGQANNN